jgi:hypothetical protein
MTTEEWQLIFDLCRGLIVGGVLIGFAAGVLAATSS